MDSAVRRPLLRAGSAVGRVTRPVGLAVRRAMRPVGLAVRRVTLRAGLAVRRAMRPVGLAVRRVTLRAGSAVRRVTLEQRGPGGFGGRGGGGGGGGGGALGGGTGLTRLFGTEWGGQISWLIPAALIAFAVMLWVSRQPPDRPDPRRRADVGGWLLVAGLVLSYMSGTTHSYYSIALAPPIGALTGIGAVGLWRIRHTWFARAALAAGLAVASAWAWVLLGRSPGWYPWVRVVIASPRSPRSCDPGRPGPAGGPRPVAYGAGRGHGDAGRDRRSRRPAGLQRGHRGQ